MTDVTSSHLIPLGLTFDDVLMVPRRTPVRSRRDVDLGTRLAGDIRLANPIVAANTPWCTGALMAAAMARHGGFGFVHRVCSADQEAGMVRTVKGEAFDRSLWPQATVDDRGRLRVGAAVGVARDAVERAQRLVEAGADALVIDVAHGHADYTLETLVQLRSAVGKVPVVAGNVATAEGTLDLIDAGASAVKVGIGPGGVCTTRLVAGAGVPQLTAVLECAAAARQRGIPVIADGGIRTSGDIVKALAAGAETVMLGSLLAGADESCAEWREVDGRSVRTTTGFVTFGMSLSLKRLAGEEIDAEELRRYVPEGVEATFAATGPVGETVLRLTGGVASGCSYSGARTLAELRANARFIRVTATGRGENGAHVLQGCAQAELNFAGPAGKGETL